MPAGAHPLQTVVLVVVLVLAVALLGLLARTTRRRPHRDLAVPAAHDGTGPEAERPLAAVVANPTKIADIDGERAWLSRRCTELGWSRPLWFETQIDEPGEAAARAAVARGAQTVIAYGGDGTVRAVAAGLEGTSAGLGILPMGTGNLLARNLGLPLSDAERAVTIALTGTERPIDVGVLEVDVSGEDAEPARQTFLVMAGLGFDAEVMASVEPALKERVGWMAYVVAGVRRLRGRSTPVTLRLDDEDPIRRRVRSVVIGNCGELTGGLKLLPDAEVDDGWLDVVVVAPRWIVGWSAVLVAVLAARPSSARGAEGRAARSSRGAAVQHLRCRSVEIRAEKPIAVQIDGDPAGEARVLRATVDYRALVVRVPTP